MTKLLRRLIEKVGQAFKGPTRTIDPAIPLSAILGYSWRRAVALLRCIARGVVISTNFRTLVFVGKCVELRNRKFIHFGKSVTLGNYVVIDGLSMDGVILGDNVNIGPYAIIEATPNVISEIGKGLRIGSNSAVGAYCFFGAAGGVTIGQDVIMGQWVSFHSANHSFNSIEQPIRLQGVTYKGIVIEDDCWIGAKATFLDGAHVGRGCVIGAGSVVRGDIPPYSIAVGVPARVVKSRIPK